ncbi:hypothetical protein DMC30DRAFT_97567 [Rhodotorula diobovata]|uniref:F-box domain-containing protein n=1 Tax=Rhodotorula diobovata TaxID=5288 RepID=A0A5C5FN88_9BASI|nr:hypothetical protein DMC30DRAFT_97567 [Rhodotorula diobovata]
MAAFASLPPELVTRIVQLAAGPVVPLSRGDSDRCDILSRLSLVRLLRHAAQNELAYAVRVGSTEQLDAVRDKAMVGGAAVRILILDNRREVLPGETDPYEPPVAAFQATLRMVALIYFDHVDLAPLAALPELEELVLEGCTVVLSQGVVFPRLARLTLRYSTAEERTREAMLSATCLPCLRHLRAIHGGSSAPDDDAERWRYLRPDADFVAQLVSFEHNDSQGPLRDGATRDGGHNREKT